MIMTREDLKLYKKNKLTCSDIARIEGLSISMVRRMYKKANLTPYHSKPRTNDGTNKKSPEDSRKLKYMLTMFTVSKECREIVRGEWS